QSRFGGKDARSEEAFLDVKRAMALVEAGERIHRLTLAVLVKGASAGQLEDHGAYLVSTLAPQVRLRPLWGQQAEALKLFTATPPSSASPATARPSPCRRCSIAWCSPARRWWSSSRWATSAGWRRRWAAGPATTRWPSRAPASTCSTWCSRR